MKIEVLGRQNPWWTNLSNIERDPFIEEYNASPIKWRPSFLDSLKLEKDVVYIIYGPRQIGKTTSFKLIIKDLLSKKNIKPKQVLYLNCEEVAPPSPQNLAKLLDDYISWVRIDSSERLFIFIDEATYLKDWERGIKILSDRGRLKKITLLATGSHVMGLRRGAERLPGRRGREVELDIFLLPLNFREYIAINKPELRVNLPVLLNWDLNSIFKSIQEISLFAEFINPLFESFLRTGGFLRSIRDWVSLGQIKADVYRLYKDAFIADLIRVGRRETIFKELAQWILWKRQNPFEWTDAARETYVGTYPTVREYIEDGEAAFVWDIFYKVKEIGKPFRAPRSPKKVNFKDPFIFHSIRAWALGYQNPNQAAEDFLKEPSNIGYIVENVVASHLKRLKSSEIFYWRNGGEIDFVIYKNGKKISLIEVKYQAKINPENAKIFKKWGGGIILTRNFLHLEKNILFAPVQYFLALLQTI